MVNDLIYFQRLWYEAKDPLMKAYYAAKLEAYCPGGLSGLRQLPPNVFELLGPDAHIVRMLL
jgi:hypothetical protein